MEIKRDYYLEKLIRKKNNGLIKIITGIRRCGKSYLLNKLFYNYLIGIGVGEDHIIKIALDNDDYSDLLVSKNLSSYIKSKMIDSDTYYLLLDEVQLVNRFEFVLNGLLYLDNIDIYVTGSNSKFLSSDIITEFRGRGDEIRLYPLSFSECMSVSKKSKYDTLSDYIEYGGLPKIVTMDDNEDKREYLEGQMKNVYVNDVVERNLINNDAELSTLIEVLASCIGSLTNPTNIYKTFVSKGNKTITNKTISLYLKYLEDAFLIEESKRFDVKGRKYIETPSKYYFTDVGLRNSIIDYRELDKTHIMENVIYTELKRRGYNVDVGMVEKREQSENGKKTYKQLEIDFIASKASEKYYIQSVYNMEDTLKKTQELNPLLSVGDNFKKIVVVYDNFSKWQDNDGITYISIYDFLLNKDSLYW